MSGSRDEIEILSTDLLELHAERRREFETLSRELGIALGWHYLLDLIWASVEIEPLLVPDARVLDAGAGIGLMQWWLVGRGAEVISLDREERLPSRALRSRYDIRPFDGETLPSVRSAAIERIRRAAQTRSGKGVSTGGEPATRQTPKTKQATTALRMLGESARDFAVGDPPRPGGATVWFGTADLRELPVEPESVDAVVSISALEHNDVVALAGITDGLFQAVRPGGAVLATVGGARDSDWFHEPSHGWCMTEATVRSAFHLDPAAQSNYERWDELFEQLRNSRTLRDGLSDFYFASGANGMPWGRWDPQYQSVGVARWKAA